MEVSLHNKQFLEGFEVSLDKVWVCIFAAFKLLFEDKILLSTTCHEGSNPTGLYEEWEESKQQVI